MEKSNTLDILTPLGILNGAAHLVWHGKLFLPIICILFKDFLLNKIHYWQFEEGFIPYWSFSSCVLYIVSQSDNTEHDLQTLLDPALTLQCHGIALKYSGRFCTSSCLWKNDLNFHSAFEGQNCAFSPKCSRITFPVQRKVGDEDWDLAALRLH